MRLRDKFGHTGQLGPGTLGPWDPGTLGPWDPGTPGSLFVEMA